MTLTFTTYQDVEFEFEGERVVMSANESRDFEDPCRFLRFMDAAVASVPSEQQGVHDSTAEGLEAIRSYCRTTGERPPDSIVPPDMPETDDPSATGTDGPPAGEETPETLGAESPTPVAELTSEPRAPGESDGRPLSQQYYDAEYPMPDYDVADILLDEGVSPDQIEGELNDVIRNEPPEGESHPEFGRDDREEPFTTIDPVDVFTGRYVRTKTDVEFPSRGFPISFKRMYISGPAYFGPLGYNWDHSYNVFLRPLEDGRVGVWTGRLSEDVYERKADGSYEPPIGVFQRLEYEPASVGSSERYTISNKQGRHQVFERPDGWPHPDRIPMVRIEDDHRNTHQLHYDGEGRLTQVSDDDGRYIQLSYNDCGLIESVVDHSERAWRYEYDPETEHLVSVVLPGTDEYPDGLNTCFEYDRYRDHPALQHNIVRVIGSDGKTVVENYYGDDPGTDDFNRIVRQYFGDYESRLSAERLQWVPRTPDAVNVPAWRVSVIDPGILVVYTFNYRGDLLDRRVRLALDGSYRLMAHAYRYDRQGNMVSQRMPNGLGLIITYDDENDDPRARGNALRLVLTGPPTGAVLDREILRVTYDHRYHRPKTIRDEAGATTTFVYDYEELSNDHGDVIRVEHPDVTLPDGTVQTAVEQFEYDSAGQLTTHTTAAGKRHEFTFFEGGNRSGLLRSVTADVGGAEATQSFVYDARGNRTQTTNGAGNTYEYIYNMLDWVTAIRLPAVDGVIDEVRYQYYPTGRPRLEELPRGDYSDGELADPFIANEYEYNILGQLSRASIGVNTEEPREWKFMRDAEGNITRAVDPAGIVTEYQYDERGKLLEQTVAAGTDDAATSRLLYDRNGTRRAIIDLAGYRTDIEYDPWDRIRRVHLPGEDEARTVVEFTSGERDSLTSVEIRGVPQPGVAPVILGTATYEYDERQRPITRTVDGVTQTAWYDPDGRLESYIDTRGAETTFEHDGLGRIISSIDPLGNARRWTFDNAGNPVAIEEDEVAPDGSATTFRSSFEYDERGNPISSTDPLGNTLQVEYDARGLPVAIEGPLGRRVEHIHDLDGNIIGRTTDVGSPPSTVEHRWERDILGRVTHYIDPEGAETDYSYTSHHQLSRITYDNGRFWEGFYRPGSTLLTREQTTGETVIDYDYTLSGEVHQVSFTPGPDVLPTAPLTVEYDGLNRPVAIEQDGKRLEREYDVHSRVVNEIYDGQQVETHYNDRSGTVDLTYPDGRRQRSHLDLLGRVESISFENIGSADLTGEDLSAGDDLVTYEYIGPVRPKKRVLANGTETEYEYDGGRRLTGLIHRQPDDGILTAAQYVYDAAGRRRVVYAEPAPSAPSMFSYDELSRVVGRFEGVSAGTPPPVTTQDDADMYLSAIDPTSATGRELFELNTADDRLVRRLEGGLGDVTERYDVTSVHRISNLTRTDSTDTTTHPFRYSPEGNLLEGDRYQYAYDALNRLIQLRMPTGDLVSFEYDPLGRCVTRTSGGSQTTRVFSGNHVLQEHQGGGSPTVQYTYGVGVDELLVASSGDNAWCHQDAVFTLLAASDDEGQPSERYTYSTFGEPNIFAPDGITPRTVSAVSAGPRFGGHVLIPGTGLYLTRSRFYDPVTGRYIQPDPLEYLDSSSPYVYAAHDPVNLIDPSGRFIWVALLIGAAIGGGVGLYYGLEQGHSGWDLAGDVAVGVGVGAAAGFTGGVAAELVAGLAGAGAFATTGTATGTGLATGLTVQQTVVLTGTAGVVDGYITRQMLSTAYPSIVAPPSAGTMIEDYGWGVAGGSTIRAMEWVGRGAPLPTTVPDAIPGPSSDNLGPSFEGPTSQPTPYEPLPPGEEPYQLLLFPLERYDRVRHYGRTPTPAQRASVPAGMEFDHDPALVVHYYEGPGGGRLPGYNLTQQERVAYARRLDIGRPVTRRFHQEQAIWAAGYSVARKWEWWGPGAIVPLPLLWLGFEEQENAVK